MRSMVPLALNQFGHFLTPDQCSVLGVRVVIMFWRKRDMTTDQGSFLFWIGSYKLRLQY